MCVWLIQVCSLVRTHTHTHTHTHIRTYAHAHRQNQRESFGHTFVAFLIVCACVFSYQRALQCADTTRPRISSAEYVRTNNRRCGVYANIHIKSHTHTHTSGEPTCTRTCIHGHKGKRIGSSRNQTVLAGGRKMNSLTIRLGRACHSANSGSQTSGLQWM